jgi:Cation transporter/ATPase, N-terminus
MRPAKPSLCKRKAIAKGVEDVLATLGTDAKHGLTDVEARERLAHSSTNKLAEKRPRLRSS